MRESELSRELEVVFRHFDAWKRGEMSPFHLSQETLVPATNDAGMLQGATVKAWPMSSILPEWNSSKNDVKGLFQNNIYSRWKTDSVPG